MLKFNLENEIKQQIYSGKLIHLIITQEEVITGDFDRARILFKTLEECKLHARNKVVITFSGYDNIPREIYEIRIISSYIKILFRMYPQLFYFLSSISWTPILLCLFKVNRVHRNELTTGVNIVPSEETIRKITDAILDYGIKVGDDEEFLWELIHNIFTHQAI